MSGANFRVGNPATRGNTFLEIHTVDIIIYRISEVYQKDIYRKLKKISWKFPADFSRISKKFWIYLDINQISMNSSFEKKT